VRRGWLLTWLSLALACSAGSGDSAREEASVPGTELIPAEWTVAEDTTSTGEVITTSMQLPAAREIAGLAETESPRLLLQCVDGRIAAFIDTAPSDIHGPGADPVAVPLDSAPSCE
jgi:hypothetical protein